MNISLTIPSTYSCYTKTKIISYMKGYVKQHPKKQRVKTDIHRWYFRLSQQSCCTFMSSNTHILKSLPPPANKYFENVTKLQYWGMIPTNKNCIYAEITSWLKCAVCANIQFRVLFVLTHFTFWRSFPRQPLLHANNEQGYIFHQI
jgi:hypothetical protein